MLITGFISGEPKVVRLQDGEKVFDLSGDTLWSHNTNTFKRLVLLQGSELYLISNYKRGGNWSLQIDHILDDKIQQQKPIPISGIPEHLLPKLRDNPDLLTECFTLDELIERIK